MIPVIIPAYEPDKRLINLLDALDESGVFPVIIVNDGSGEQYNDIFIEAERIVNKNDGVLLVHEQNRGKGRALKTAFQYVLDVYGTVTGVVTADSDGQHSVSCIKSIIDELENNPTKLILGIRDFSGDGIPWKSRFGNALTEKVFAYVSGLHVSDTQTGLRGIPCSFMKELLTVPGERFEFETQMLLESSGRYPIKEVSIETIYDSEEEHQTHFHPIVDSIKIYRIFGKRFLRYIFSSLSSSIIDLLLFTLFCMLLKSESASYVIFATVFARIISAVYNYFINYKLVFNSRKSICFSSIKYVVLAIVQMSLSAILVSGGVAFIPIVPEVVIKTIVDTCLFFISYKIQQKLVF